MPSRKLRAVNPAVEGAGKACLEGRSFALAEVWRELGVARICRTG
jgi:hypothetical protein